MSKEEKEKLKQLEENYNKLLILLDRIVDILDKHVKTLNMHTDAIKKLSEIDFSL